MLADMTRSHHDNPSPPLSTWAGAVGNLTTNYSRYRREHAIEMRAREGKPPGAFVFVVIASLA
jgi:hypothetical protein